MRITMFGAAGEVTGSAYLVETSQARLLVDFGMFQGGRDDEERNVVPAALDARRLDAVLLTHAHIDHTGRLPLLPRAGFRGRVYGTEATLEAAELLLEDSAGLQRGDLRRANSRRERAGLDPLPAPYDDDDLRDLFGRFTPLPYDAPSLVAPGVTAQLVEAGHMLGSASIKLALQDGDRTRRVVFSGDIGPVGAAILRDPGRLSGADLVVLESTYGDRDHRPIAETVAEFERVVAEVARRGGKLLIPSFAVGRAQAVLFYLARLFNSGKVRPFPIYLDSPLAIKAKALYDRHPELNDETLDDPGELRQFVRDLRTLELCESADESRALNGVRGPCAIIAGSGMANGGRILHHLRHNLWKPDTAVLIVGYQGEGTLGRALVDGARTVRIFGEPVAVRATVHTINGLSAHAGQSGLLDWLAPLAATAPRVLLTHGEERARVPLARRIQELHGITCELPSYGEAVIL
jgi:metallo-beta-lactamase family protein